MSSRRGEGGAQGGILINCFGPGVGHLNYLAVPGVGIFEFLFVPVTTNHFTGGEFQLYLTPHFCPGVGNLTAIFWKMSKSRPMPQCIINDIVQYMYFNLIKTRVNNNNNSFGQFFNISETTIKPFLDQMGFVNYHAFLLFFDIQAILIVK